MVFLGSGLSMAREWTAATDGKKFDAEFVSSAYGKITLKRAADGK